MSYVTGKQTLDYHAYFLERISALNAPRRAVLTFVLGALSVLSLPPFHLWPVLFVTFPLLLIIVSSVLDADIQRQKEPTLRSYYLARFRAAWAIGWYFGFGYFVAGLYWFGHAFMVEAERFALLMPLAVIAMPAFLGLFYGLAVAPLAFMRSVVSIRLLGLTVGFGLMEWVRGTILTGFPWNSIGYAFASNDLLLQSASLVGLYGLNFVAVFVFTSPVLFFKREASTRIERYSVLSVAGLIFMSAMLWGYFRLESGVTTFRDNILLRIVQPNIPQKQKMDPKYLSENFRTLMDLSRRGPDNKGLKGVTHVIWPEVAVRALIAGDDTALQAIGDMLPPKTYLLTGTLRLEDIPGRPRQVYNSLIAINDLGVVTGKYDKVHLVPFGEYLPLQPWLEAIGLQQLTRQRGGFAAGRDARMMFVPGLPVFTPLICYEVIFPNQILDHNGRSGWLLNITNDAWFGHSTGPYQHFHQTRMRAVEEGLPVVRVANTGVSAIVDGYGKTLKRMNLGVKGVFDFQLPKELKKTFYVWNRALIFPFFLIILGLLITILNIWHIKKRSK